MKALHALLLCVVLAAAAAVWFLVGAADPGDDAPLPGAVVPAGDAAAGRGGAVAPAIRSEVPAPAQPPLQTPGTATAPTTATGTPPPPAPAVPTENVLLQVRHATTLAPVAAFRWRVRSAAGTVRGLGQDGRAEFTLPAGERGELTVEADGFTPHMRPELQAPDAGAAQLAVEVFLTPAALATGITLQVHDPNGQPVPNVRVEPFVLNADNRDLTWQLGKPVWSRAATAADGRYVLPELAPGEYGLRVLALDATGQVLPMLPFLRPYTLTGNNGFVEDVTLEPGCMPVLELVNPAGAPLDPAHGAITLSLRLAGGPAVQRLWQQQRTGPAGEAAGLVGSIDALPVVGPGWPAEPVAAGSYQLSVFVDGQPALERSLVLRAGERQPERLLVPR